MFKLFNTSQYFAGSSETLEILKRQKKENKKTKRQKQKKNCPSEFFTNYRGSHPVILEYLFLKIQENPRKTSVIVSFDLILTIRALHLGRLLLIIWESRRNGFPF